MSEPSLRLHDGFPHTSPERESEVRELQSVLGHCRPEVVVDGLFGRGTEEALRACQRAFGLPADGVVRPGTWQALLEPAAAPYVAERIPSGYPLDDPDLLEELEAAARHGDAVEEAAASTGIPPAVIVALGSRESRFGLALVPRGPSGTSDFVPRPRPAPNVAGRCRRTGRASGGVSCRSIMMSTHSHGTATGAMRAPASPSAAGSWPRPRASFAVAPCSPHARCCARRSPPTTAVRPTSCARCARAPTSTSTPLAETIRPTS
jgi:hypothetical protein